MFRAIDQVRDLAACRTSAELLMHNDGFWHNRLIGMGSGFPQISQAIGVAEAAELGVLGWLKSQK